MLTISSLQHPITPTESFNSCLSHFSLKWDGSKLLVLPVKNYQTYYYSLEKTDTDFILQCLKRSNVLSVWVDCSLGTEHLQFWSEVCKAADKKFSCLQKQQSEKNSKQNQFIVWLKSIFTKDKIPTRHHDLTYSYNSK